jgi:hypothetical protein
MFVDERHDRRRGRSCSAAKYALAAFKISLMRRNSSTSSRSRRFSSTMSVVGRSVALAAVGLVLADPVPQRLVVHTQLLGQPPEARLRFRLPVQPHRALA